MSEPQSFFDKIVTNLHNYTNIFKSKIIQSLLDIQVARKEKKTNSKWDVEKEEKV